MPSLTITDKTQINRAFNALDGQICKLLESGPVRVTVDNATKRTSTQNSKQWAMYTDIANQLTWHGKKMDKKDWKDLICHEWIAQKIVPSISGGFCVLNARTSKATKKEIGDLIEIIYSFGASHGVIWSEQSLKLYDEYSKTK